MQRMSRHKSGFTLVEVAVIMPIAVLIIGAMIGTILYLTNVSLRTQGRSKLQVEVVTALDRMEQDVRNALEIKPSTSSEPLQIVALATDKDPIDITRRLINNSDCVPAVSGLAPANALKYTVTYRTQTGGGTTSLLRTVTLGSTSSCSSGNIANIWQKTGNETLIPGAKSVTIGVSLSSQGSSTGNNTAMINLSSERVIAGQSTTFSGSMYAKSVNVR